MPIEAESTSTVTIVVALRASVTVTVQVPGTLPELTVKVATPPVGVALVAASAATNPDPLGVGVGVGSGDALLVGCGEGDGATVQLMPAVKAAVSPVSLTVNGADVGVPASNVSKAGEATGVGASVGVGDGDGDGDPDELQRRGRVRGERDSIAAGRARAGDRRLPAGGRAIVGQVVGCAGGDRRERDADSGRAVERNARRGDKLDVEDGGLGQVLRRARRVHRAAGRAECRRPGEARDA